MPGFKKNVVIGIPVYKINLSKNEEISLRQVERILSKYEKVFIAPESLGSIYAEKYKYLSVKTFPDKYFDDIAGYNKLLLSEDFYQCFIEYKYLLIYQLDAFVFKDELSDFCAMDYDYIGAPWTYATKPPDCKSYVGNGGLSLRNVKNTISLLKKTKEINELWDRNEDVFFALCGADDIHGFKVAPTYIAKKFSLEENFQSHYKKEKLPFGCHGWFKFDDKVITEILYQYGYIKYNEKYETCYNIRKNRESKIIEYLYKRCLRSENDKKWIKPILKEMFHKTAKFAIFGAANDGYNCYQFLKNENINVECFFDNSLLKQGALVDGILIRGVELNWIINRNIIILIASRNYEESIMSQLRKIGLINRQDYMSFLDLKNLAIKKYLKNVSKDKYNLNMKILSKLIR